MRNPASAENLKSHCVDNHNSRIQELLGSGQSRHIDTAPSQMLFPHVPDAFTIPPLSPKVNVFKELRAYRGDIKIRIFSLSVLNEDALTRLIFHFFHFLSRRVGDMAVKLHTTFS